MLLLINCLWSEDLGTEDRIKHSPHLLLPSPLLLPPLLLPPLLSVLIIHFVLLLI